MPSPQCEKPCEYFDLQKKKVKFRIRSVLSGSLQPHGLYSPWNSPGQNTEVGSLSLLQGIFQTQGWNPGLLHCRQILYQLSHKGSPWAFRLNQSTFSILFSFITSQIPSVNFSYFGLVYYANVHSLLLYLKRVRIVSNIPPDIGDRKNA